MVTEAERATIGRLMGMLSGDVPLTEGLLVFAPDVVYHIDGMQFRGVPSWAKWIAHIRAVGRVTDPEVRVDTIDPEADGTVMVRGRWTGWRDGVLEVSQPCEARYRFDDGRIVEVWSTRHNYAFLAGAHVNYWGGFLYELGRVAWE